MKNFSVLNRLWVRLALAFAIVAGLGIGIAAVLANQAIDREFRTFVVSNEANLQNTTLANTLIEYYTLHQSWSGVDKALPRNLFAPGPNPAPGGPRNNQPPDQGPRVTLRPSVLSREERLRGKNTSVRAAGRGTRRDCVALVPAGRRIQRHTETQRRANVPSPP